MNRLATMLTKGDQRKYNMHKNRSKKEKSFDFFNVMFMIILAIVTIYPFWYILVLSFNNGQNAAEGPIWLIPRMFTLDNYRFVFNYPNLISSFFITLERCIIGPAFSVGVCMFAAYALSKRWLVGRKVIIYFLMIPMFLGGTVISYYILYAKLGFLNNFAVYVVPGAFSFFSMIIMRTFIEDIPVGLEESMMLDGANWITIFFRLILPMSKPIIAALAFLVLLEIGLTLEQLFYLSQIKHFTHFNMFYI